LVVSRLLKPSTDMPRVRGRIGSPVLVCQMFRLL
jgi:hypothetical protein